MTDLLTVSAVSSRYGTVVVVAGRLVTATSATLGGVLGEVLRGAGGRRVTVDLSRLDFVDGSGVGLLALYRAAAARLGVVLRVAAPPPHVQRMIDKMGVDLSASARSAGPPRSWPARCRPGPQPAPPARTRPYRCPKAGV